LRNPGLGDCWVRHIRDYGTLDSSDFDAPSIGNDPGVLIGATQRLNVGWVSIDVKNAVQDDLDHRRDFAAFMIGFSTISDNDGRGDSWDFYSVHSAYFTDNVPYFEFSLRWGIVVDPPSHSRTIPAGGSA
jgi:hypothetical protein